MSKVALLLSSAPIIEAERLEGTCIRNLPTAYWADRSQQNFGVIPARPGEFAVQRSR